MLIRFSGGQSATDQSSVNPSITHGEDTGLGRDGHREANVVHTGGWARQGSGEAAPPLPSRGRPGVARGLPTLWSADGTVPTGKAAGTSPSPPQPSPGGAARPLTFSSSAIRLSSRGLLHSV